MNVTHDTRAGKRGKRIACPHCAAMCTVFNLSWSALTCRMCKADVEKLDWLIPGAKDMGKFDRCWGSEAYSWACNQPDQSPEVLWKTCPRADWLIVAADVLGADSRDLVRATCAIIRSIDLLIPKGDNSRTAAAKAEAWARTDAPSQDARGWAVSASRWAEQVGASKLGDDSPDMWTGTVFHERADIVRAHIPWGKVSGEPFVPRKLTRASVKEHFLSAYPELVYQPKRVAALASYVIGKARP